MFPSAQRRKIGHLVDNGKTITLYGVEKNQPKITLLLWKTVVQKKDNLTALYKSYCSKTMGRTAACAPSLITIAGFTNLSRKNICMENNVEVV